MRNKSFILRTAPLAFLALAAVGTQPLSAQTPSGPKTSRTPALQSEPLAAPADDAIRTPFSKSEETFYQQAWPIRKSHSAQALLLMGGVFLILLFLLLRRMAKSPPRKPPVQ